MLCGVCLSTAQGYTDFKLFHVQSRVERWAWPTFFSAYISVKDLEKDIQQQLNELDSALDLVALERPGTESLRIFIDHPEGVDLALCERVTEHLNHLLVDYSLEVSSPGPKYSRPSPVSETAKEQP
jgi:hypothetical protein